MSYTMTYDVSHKVGRGGHAKAFFRHIARDVDQAAGFHFPQANPNIVADRTKLNSTFVNDGNGGYRRPQSVDGRPPSDEFDDYLQQRLSTVQRALRRDAVLIRGVVLQLDPKWFEQYNPDWREEGLNRRAAEYTHAAIRWARGEFGEENIIGMSMHLEGPADLKRQHREVRDAVAAAGYDVEYRVTERSREHLSSSEFQAKADRLRDAASALEFELDVSLQRNKRLAKRSTVLDEREKELAERETQVAERHREAAAARARAADEAAAARTSSLRAREAHLKAERAREEAAAERDRLALNNQRLDSLPPFFERWLDRTTVAGKPIRTRFEADRIKMRSEIKAKLGPASTHVEKRRDALEL
ncbi:plasmid recombination protein [Microbacterium sp. NPDC078849]|uniref:plasmid recombination protein n=1 Tax=unclassified Microbacterium TaxID=2609290 RepID=UPI003450335F